MIQAMQKGKFMYLTPTEAYNFLQELGTYMQTWDIGNKTDDYDRSQYKPGIYEVRQDPEIKTVLQELNKLMEAIASTLAL